MYSKDNKIVTIILFYIFYIAIPFLQRPSNLIL
jgi:hypothetical protein